jgi:hypothetical protein
VKEESSSGRFSGSDGSWPGIMDLVVEVFLQQNDGDEASIAAACCY